MSEREEMQTIEGLLSQFEERLRSSRDLETDLKQGMGVLRKRLEGVEVIALASDLTGLVDGLESLVDDTPDVQIRRVLSVAFQILRAEGSEMPFGRLSPVEIEARLRRPAA